MNQVIENINSNAQNKGMSINASFDSSDGLVLSITKVGSANDSTITENNFDN